MTMNLKHETAWKRFDEIDIEKDKLYCWYFDIPTYDCDKIDVGVLWYNYNTIKINMMNILKFQLLHIFDPSEKESPSFNGIDLFQIKNEFIDVTVSQKYIPDNLYRRM